MVRSSRSDPTCAGPPIALRPRSYPWLVPFPNVEQSRIANGSVEGLCTQKKMADWRKRTMASRIVIKRQLSIEQPSSTSSEV